MKNAFFLAAALLLGGAAVAQTDTTNRPVAPAPPAAAPIQVPEHLKGVTSETLRPEHYLPVLGQYRALEGDKDLTVTLDESNIGIVWIDGLPQGRVKALLRKSPATYKIPAQKTAEGKSVPEGTLHFDPLTKEVALLIGRPYNEADPASVFASEVKSKAVWKYKGQKVETVVMAAHAVQ